MQQCGEAAFAAMDHSIKERDTLKLSLDPTVLILRNVELRGIAGLCIRNTLHLGASTVPDSAPWFIFTFSAQQINCMRDATGNVVVGAIDDIREVVYSVALRKHPLPQTACLEYPWQVTEFAIIESNPCW